MTPHASIDISFATRANPVDADEAPIACAVCNKLRPFAGAAIVNTVPLSAGARRRGEIKAREEMLPLCDECFCTPNVSNAMVRSYIQTSTSSNAGT
jgi:hypothetical protein